MLLKRQQRDIAVGKPPHGQRLEGGPDGDATGQTPKHVVQYLIVKGERLVVLRLLALFILERLALLFILAKVQMKTTGNNDHQREIAPPHLRDPSEFKLATTLKGRLQVQPGRD